MNKRRYAVIGHPIGHTMSPFIHERLFRLRGIVADYEVYNISPYDLHGAVPALRALDGYNITIPHKQQIISYLDSLDRKAQLYGSVNTVKNGETSTGYTTDPDGFLNALRLAGVPLRGRVVILGCGGAARVMAFEAALAGCETVIAVRPQSLSKVARLAGDLHTAIPFAQVSTCLISRISGRIDLLLNATPVGMFPETDGCPAPVSVIETSAAVFDAIYNPEETLLLKRARANGAKTVGGMSMLVYQAAAAHTIWDGSQYTEEDIRQLCEDTACERNRLFGQESA